MPESYRLVSETIATNSITRSSVGRVFLLQDTSFSNLCIFVRYKKSGELRCYLRALGKLVEKVEITD